MKNLVYILFLLSFPIFGKDECENITSESQKAKCYQERYRVVDKELNKAYKLLKGKLNENKLEDMKNNSKQWVGYKDGHCELVSEKAEKSKQKIIDKYFCLVSLTEERLLFLKRAFGRDGVSAGIPGTYDDSFGGSLEIKKSSSDNYSFKVNVVRGANFSTGELDGIISLKGNKGKYIAKGEERCELNFSVSDNSIQLLEENPCTYYYGAGAYFNGNYYKVK